VVTDGGPARVPAKQRVLLTALLMRANRAVSAQTLIETLWDATPPRSARVTAQGYVKGLRQILGREDGQRIVTRDPGYLITVAPGELDLERFMTLTAGARAAAARGDWPGAAAGFGEALAWWRGVPLADVPSAVLQREEVPRLAELRLNALESRIEADLYLGRHAELVAELRQLAGAEPLRERVHGLLMLALYRSGRQAEALAVFRGIDGMLRGELGIGPGAGLRDLHQRMLAADPALDAGQDLVRGGRPDGEAQPAAALSAAALSAAALSAVAPTATAPPAAELPTTAPAQLPGDTADFTGRDSQVNLLSGLLGTEPAAGRPGVVMILAVAGMGGIGKTALAVHVAHRLRDRFPDGQLYVNLQGTTHPLLPAEVLASFLRDLGVADESIPQTEADRSARYRTLLAARKVLIVLDDARDVAQIRPLLPGSAGCGVIVTSRGTMPDLAGAARLDLQGLSQDEARELFTTIVGADRVAAEPGATARLLACCAGLPLAVRIAASRLASRPGWSVAHQAARLADERQRLAELAAGDLAVRASFAVSYDALPAEAGGVSPARLFRLLGLADMTVLSLPAVAALAGVPAADMAPALDILTDAHLLQAPAPDRYRLHDLLRSYAAELAAQADGESGRHQALRRLLSWYGEQTVRAARALIPRLPAHALFQVTGPRAMADPAAAIDWHETEQSNLAAAVRLAAGLGWHDIVVQISAAMWAFLSRNTYRDDWLPITQAGVASARQLDDGAVLSWLLVSLGQRYCARFQEGQFSESLACFTEALEIRRRIGDSAGEGAVLSSIGNMLETQDRLEESLHYLRSSVAVHAMGTDRRLLGVSLHNTGHVLMRMERYDEALEHLTHALAIRREIADRYGEGLTETTIAQLCVALGRFEEAVGHYRQSWAAVRDTAPRAFEQAEALYGLGSALAALGRSGEARDAWRAALPALERITDPRAAELRERLAEDEAASAGVTHAAPVPAGGSPNGAASIPVG
jgi:DNA-binding SARP family transcriptional activator/tetratricopeptide (TPR) repeat protein